MTACIRQDQAKVQEPERSEGHEVPPPTGEQLAAGGSCGRGTATVPHGFDPGEVTQAPVDGPALMTQVHTGSTKMIQWV